MSNVRFSNSLIDISIDSSDNIYITDCARKEVVVVRNCTRAKKVKKAAYNTMKVKGLLSSAVSRKDDFLYVLRQKKSGLVVQLMSFDLKSRKGVGQRSLEYTVSLKMHPSMEIRKLFALPFERCYGGMDANGTLKLLYHTAKSKGGVTEHNLEPTAFIKPYVHLDGSMLVATGNGLDVYKLKFYSRTATTEFIAGHQFDGTVISSCMNSKVLSAATLEENRFSLMEIGPLDFGIKYAEAISGLYDSICYAPPRGDKVELLEKRKISLADSILKAQTCASLMTALQQEAVERDPGRSSFKGADGMPFSDTIHCLESTIDSWKTLEKRVELMEGGSSSGIYPPSIGSEKNVEHSFGYVKKKGQGHNQDMRECLISKRRHTVDFQIRMCKTPFCQDTKEKIQDKGYQQIEGNRFKITIKGLRQIFQLSEKESCSHHFPDITEEDEHLLKKAYLFTKSVPRQSNRAKWREKSGFQPNMLLEQNIPGMLYKDDLVCCRSIEDTLMFLVVQDDVLLNHIDVKISVCFPGGTINFQVATDKLVTENGQIMALPKQLYKIIEGEVILSDAVSRDFEVLQLNQGEMLTDEEWALLLDDGDVPTEFTVSIVRTPKRKEQEDHSNEVATFLIETKKEVTILVMNGTLCESLMIYE